MRTSAVTAGVILFASLVSGKSAAPTIGEIIYRQGITAAGVPVNEDRGSGGISPGANAACVNCHRPSGLGAVEGGILCPPITAKYLFRRGIRYGQEETHSVSAIRSVYTDTTLARAIRDGIDPDGRTLKYLMPRYNLDDAAMTSLIAYLKELSSGPVPGTTADTLHFATIVTPDADPVKRKGMLDVLEHFVAAKNVFYRHLLPPARDPRWMYHIPRKWQLHVWDLAGEPETWGEQLHNRLKSEPVFAVISGLGGKNWEPIHQFCQQESIPCLFPNVDLPVVSESDFYDLYFSKGVLLEAGLIAHQIHDISGTAGIRRIVQVYREGDVGAEAAKALRNEIAAHGLVIIERPLTQRAAGGDLSAALEKAGAQDALVLWLRADDLRNLPLEPPKSPSVFVSGLMGGLEGAPIQGAWRGVTSMTYPYELPTRRGALQNYPVMWFNIQHIPLVAEQTQVDTYIACNIVGEILNDMQENFVRDYLIECAEDKLSSRIVNGNYPRLGLAPGQRFASKGGYIVRFAGADGNKLVPEGDWIVP
ncbi:MAG TPA: cytochrome C [Acidobacteriota bacterium]|nr:cytochrome C [Acidobacteriota bacterium]